MARVRALDAVAHDHVRRRHGRTGRRVGSSMRLSSRPRSAIRNWRSPSVKHTSGYRDAPKPRAQRRAVALVDRVVHDAHDARVLGGERVREGTGVVLRAVVDRDDLERLGASRGSSRAPPPRAPRCSPPRCGRGRSSSAPGTRGGGSEAVGTPRRVRRIAGRVGVGTGASYTGAAQVAIDRGQPRSDGAPSRAHTVPSGASGSSSSASAPRWRQVAVQAHHVARAGPRRDTARRGRHVTQAVVDDVPVVDDRDVRPAALHVRPVPQRRGVAPPADDDHGVGARARQRRVQPAPRAGVPGCVELSKRAGRGTATRTSVARTTSTRPVDRGEPPDAAGPGRLGLVTGAAA